MKVYVLMNYGQNNGEYEDFCSGTIYVDVFGTFDEVLNKVDELIQSIKLKNSEIFNYVTEPKVLDDEYGWCVPENAILIAAVEHGDTGYLSEWMDVYYYYEKEI